MIESLSHITFIVRDIERTAALFTTLLDATEVYDSGNETHSISRERFFIIGGTWIAIMEGEALAEKTYNHIAFKIADTDFDEYVERIKKAGLEIRIGRARVEGEAKSVYFHDFDNHLFELHTGTLSERLKTYTSSKE